MDNIDAVASSTPMATRTTARSTRSSPRTSWRTRRGPTTPPGREGAKAADMVYVSFPDKQTVIEDVSARAT